MQSSLVLKGAEELIKEQLGSEANPEAKVKVYASYLADRCTQLSGETWTSKNCTNSLRSYGLWDSEQFPTLQGRYGFYVLVSLNDLKQLDLWDCYVCNGKVKRGSAREHIFECWIEGVSCFNCNTVVKSYEELVEHRKNCQVSFIPYNYGNCPACNAKIKLSEMRRHVNQCEDILSWEEPEQPSTKETETPSIIEVEKQSTVEELAKV